MSTFSLPRGTKSIFLSLSECCCLYYPLSFFCVPPNWQPRRAWLQFPAPRLIFIILSLNGLGLRGAVGLLSHVPSAWLREPHCKSEIIMAYASQVQSLVWKQGEVLELEWGHQAGNWVGGGLWGVTMWGRSMSSEEKQMKRTSWGSMPRPFKGAARELTLPTMGK